MLLSCTPIIMVKFEVKAVFQMELHTNQEKEVPIKANKNTFVIKFKMNG